jgi:hypothetical protein
MDWVLSAQSLKRHGMRVVAVVVDAASFGGYNRHAGVVETLWAGGVAAFRIKHGDDLVAALSYSSWTAQRHGMAG